MAIVRCRQLALARGLLATNARTAMHMQRARACRMRDLQDARAADARAHDRAACMHGMYLYYCMHARDGRH